SLLRVVLLLVSVVALRSEGVSQTYFKPNTSNTLYAYCSYFVGGTEIVVPYCNISLSTTVYLYTGGHFHENESHPFSSITPTSANTGPTGVVFVTLNTTRVGQQEAAFVTNDDNGSTKSLVYLVGHNDVYYNHHPEIWDKVGGTDTGADTGHGNTDINRYMEINAAYGIYYATTDYLALHPEQPRICLNDMGLPFGGKFDISKNWNSPHAEHDRGKAVDVGDANSRQCSIRGSALPLANRAEFRQKCIDHGAIANLSYIESDKNHVHCGWGVQ